MEITPPFVGNGKGGGVRFCYNFKQEYAKIKEKA